MKEELIKDIPIKKDEDGNLYFRADEIENIINEQDQEIEKLNKIIEIKNNRIQQLMNRTRSARIDKALEYINTNLLKLFEEIEYCNDKDILDQFAGKIERILKGDDNE